METMSSACCVAERSGGSLLRGSGIDTVDGRRDNELEVDWGTDMAEALSCTDTVEGVSAPVTIRLCLLLLAEDRTLAFHRAEALDQNFCFRRASFSTKSWCSDALSPLLPNFSSSSFSRLRRFFRRQMMNAAMNTHMTKVRTSEVAKMSVTRELLTFGGGFQPFGMVASNWSTDSVAGGDEMIVEGWIASLFGVIVGSQFCCKFHVRRYAIMAWSSTYGAYSRTIQGVCFHPAKHAVWALYKLISNCSSLPRFQCLCGW